jgi:peptidoglycan/xylan/chitin deacetylase (PgdA/CDA1 family)
MMFGGKHKAITFSFDDGITDDIRLVELLNKYGLKATFNLNAGHLTGALHWRYKDVKEVRHINYYDHPHLYDGHEVACHGYTHPHLENLDEPTMDNQVRLDKFILEKLYQCSVRGMAYPYGTYNDALIEVLQNNGIAYCRTVKSTYDFGLPAQPLTWHPTCHFKDERRMELAEAFVNARAEEDVLFYIWGHSYELVTEEDWAAFEQFCAFIAGRDDICYCTNLEVLER